ncbi:uncharacterized protein LOC117109053 [Anneissia japonica]|uniref:uncharacterized protein LOC117109053 n=1 Tax=Anneissia japonica TaxID=1529436 RepID=UPI001425A92E|nr:uncharacterized protein LOC117109053 [Anneissia japonica]
MGFKVLCILSLAGFFVFVSSQNVETNRTPEDVSKSETVREEGMRIVQRIYSILDTIKNMERNKKNEERRKTEITEYNPKRRPGGDFSTQAWRKKRSTIGKNLMEITFVQRLDSETMELRIEVKEFLQTIGQWLRKALNKSHIDVGDTGTRGFFAELASNEEVFVE